MNFDRTGESEVNIETRHERKITRDLLKQAFDNVFGGQSFLLPLFGGLRFRSPVSRLDFPSQNMFILTIVRMIMISKEVMHSQILQD